MEKLVAILINESKWFAPAVLFGISLGLGLLLRHRHSSYPLQERLQIAMNIFFGTLMATMAFGHLLAVTLKWYLGSLKEGSVFLFYIIGMVLIVPYLQLLRVARKAAIAKDVGKHKAAIVGTNVWLIVTILSVGIYNLPLAAPGLLTLGHVYSFNKKGVLSWLIVAVAGLLYVGLLVGGINFFISGQSFEDFAL